MLRAALRTLLALALLPALLAADEEILREFRKYFRKYKDTPTRVEAILSLEGTEDEGVVEALVPLLDEDEAQVVDACVRVLGGLRSAGPVQALLEEVEDARGEELAALLRVVADAAHPQAVPFVLPALEDRDWEVRRRAIQALVAIGGEGVPAAVAPLCGDSEAGVRCAALDGLARLRSELVVAPALEALTADAWQVRASAIAALGKVRRREAIEPLIGRLREEEGRLQEDIGKALDAITGRNFGTRVDGWENFWELYRDRFVVPTDEELARLREAQAQRREEYQPSEAATTYHGIETPSRSVLFVIDVSGSMESEVIEKERFEDGDYPSFTRMDIVKTELQRTIEGLESEVNFNILSFATDVDFWKKKLVTANVLNKSSAIDWVGRLEPIGGNSKGHLAAAGLAGTADLESGKTNTHGALMEALGIPLERRRRRGRADYLVDVDTIFFLSDGRPSHGEFVDPDDILREVQEANALRRVVIHSIAIGQFRKDFMERLATENEGVFVDLGR